MLFCYYLHNNLVLKKLKLFFSNGYNYELDCLSLLGHTTKIGELENRGQQQKDKKDYSYATYICVIQKKYQII